MTTTTLKKLKRRIRKQSASTILRRLLKVKGKFLHDVMARMDITYPTLSTYMENPKLMTGHHRELFAKELGIPIDVIDDIINGRYADVEGVLAGTYATAYKYKGYEKKAG